MRVRREAVGSPHIRPDIPGHSMGDLSFLPVKTFSFSPNTTLTPLTTQSHKGGEDVCVPVQVVKGGLVGWPRLCTLGSGGASS